ncbi:MAG TPA: holo-ACP synthase, partial [Thermoanaerobaculia bacterium]|nr:holo-ACP synthase [Thermoanaerobaculia bacterium]
MKSSRHGNGGILLGLDLTRVDRIARALDRWGERFLARVFEPGELRRRRGQAAFAEHVAGRFAAKEAAMKALGTGFRGVAFREVSVGRDARGKPRLRFRGRALERARKLHVRATEVSITHTGDLAAAVVALLTD